MYDCYIHLIWQHRLIYEQAVHACYETRPMRTVFAGFLLGYMMVSYMIAPMVLWALQVVPSYTSGVVMVMDRSGVLAPLKQGMDQTAQFRDRQLVRLAEYIGSKLSPPASN